MKYHILNGDALAAKFPKEAEGQKIIIREAFIEGPLSPHFDGSFWESRAAFVSGAYNASQQDYQDQFGSQLQLLNSITNVDEVYLWFEDDLFCLTNMWFSVVYVSKKTTPTFYRIFPEKDEKRWSGFGKSERRELLEAYRNAVKLDDEETELTKQLWEAYTTNDAVKLKALSFSDTEGHRFLPKVIEAHLDRTPNCENEFGRPQQTLIDILGKGKTEFYEIFDDFWKTEAIYGFGDLQVYNMLKDMEVEFDEQEF